MHEKHEYGIAPMCVIANAPDELAVVGNAMTLTMDQLLRGVLVISSIDGNRTVTLPTAALLLQGMPPQYRCVGGSFWVDVVNMDDSSTLNIEPGSGGTRTGLTDVVAATSHARLFIRITSVSAASPTYTFYVLKD